LGTKLIWERLFVFLLCRTHLLDDSWHF
jgi:hypothetical protein